MLYLEVKVAYNLAINWMFFFCLLYSLILQCSTRVKPQEMTCFVAFIMTSLSLPHGYIPLPVSEILFFCTDTLDFILLFWLPTVANFLRLQLFVWILCDINFGCSGQSLNLQVKDVLLKVGCTQASSCPFLPHPPCKVENIMYTVGVLSTDTCKKCCC